MPDTAAAPEKQCVRSIVKDWLIRNGYDGLYNETTECGCDLDNLMDCEYNPFECRPGYKTSDPSGEFLYVIQPKQQ